MDILSLVVGGSIGFLASIAKDWLIENKKQKLKKQEFQREKLEEIYLLFDKWDANFGSTYLVYLHCYRSELTYQNVLQHIEKLEKSNFLLPGEFQKLQMLINIHFPQLANDYISVDKARSKVAYFLVNPKEYNRSSEDFIKVQEEFEVASKEFKLKIITQAQKINL